MNFSKFIDIFVKEYKQGGLNEADTRFRVIDEILEKILAWPKSSIACEVITDGVRADYVLKNKAGKTVLVIESKREGVYFELPSFVNSNAHYTKVQMSKLLSDPNIKQAVVQVKEYCEDLGCNYGAITNGYVWIIFLVTPQNAPWKTLPAFVIKNLLFFKDNYTTAINLLGYNAIVNDSSLKKQIGVTRIQSEEIYYPKDQITAYNTFINNNSYAGTMNVISRKYLGNIPYMDEKFFKNCYVINKGHYDDLEKNVQNTINDSLTPYYRNLNVVDIRDEIREGGALAIKIEQIIKQENLDNVMILFGGRGAGKSTFINRLLFHVRPREITEYAVTVIVDLINAAQVKDELSKEIWEKVCEGIDKDEILKANRSTLLKLFDDRFKIHERQVLEGLAPHDYAKELNTFIKNCKNNVKYSSQRLSNYWKQKNKGLIIILDNIDQLSPELQDACFLTAIEIAKKLSCLVIISMREERYYNAKSRGVLDAYHTPNYHLASPVIPEVILKRLQYIIPEINKAGSEVATNISEEQLETVVKFLSVCRREIRRPKAALSNFLRYATHGDVRQALEFFKGFITSGYTNISEIAPHEDWKFQPHQVLKPMMIPNRFFYNEITSKIPNIYQIRNEANGSHFCGVKILDFLNRNNHDKLSSGFVDASFIIQKFEETYDLKQDCIKNLDIFLSRGLIESNNRTEEFSENVDQVKITAFGKYVLDVLAIDFTYLDLVCLDCGIIDLNVNNHFVVCANKELGYYQSNDFYSRILSRLDRVLRFITYLGEQEDKEFIEFSLHGSETSFVERIRNNFDIQKERILYSAQHKLENGSYL